MVKLLTSAAAVPGMAKLIAMARGNSSTAIRLIFHPFGTQFFFGGFGNAVEHLGDLSVSQGALVAGCSEAECNLLVRCILRSLEDIQWLQLNVCLVNGVRADLLIDKII